MVRFIKMKYKERQKLLNSEGFKSLSPEAQREVRTFLGRGKSITLKELNEMERLSEERAILELDFMQGEPPLPPPIDFLELSRSPETKMERIKRLNPEKWKKWQDIAGMRSMGMTLEMIAKQVGVTRERVRQIERDMGLPPRGGQWRFYGKVPKVQPTRKCEKCGKEFPVRKYNPDRKFCSKTCAVGLDKPIGQMTPEERRKYTTEKTKAYYHAHKNDPRQIARLKRYREDPRFIAYHKEYNKRKQKSPEYKKKQIESQRRKLQKIYADPVLHEKHKEKQKLRYRKYEDRKRNERLEHLRKVRQDLIDKGFDPKLLKQI